MTRTVFPRPAARTGLPASGAVNYAAIRALTCAATCLATAVLSLAALLPVLPAQALGAQVRPPAAAAPPATPRTPATTPDTVRGLAFDSLAWKPLAGAMVMAEPGGETAVSDAAGRFTIISPQRVMRLVAFHEMADELGLGELTATRPDSDYNWDRPIVATPGMDAVWQRICAPARRPAGGNGGIVFGTVTGADGSTRVAGLGMVLQWESVSSIADTVARLESITTRSDSLGNYAFCGVQEFGSAAMVASSSTWRSGSIFVPASPSSLRRRDIIVGPTAGQGAFATVQGRVVDEKGVAVPDVTISIDGFVAEIQSGPNGRFTLNNVPTGTRMVTARRLGYLPTSVAIDITSKGVERFDIPLERTTALETVVTRTERPKNRDARELDERKLANKARFLDSTYFSQYQSTRLALATAPGVRTVMGRAPGDFVVRGRGDCLASLWVNGQREPNDYDNLLAKLPKDALAAVEIFPTEMSAPARFQTPGGNCSVILVWTKAHINADR